MNFDQQDNTQLWVYVNENFGTWSWNICKNTKVTFVRMLCELNPLKADLKGRIQVSFVDQLDWTRLY